MSKEKIIAAEIEIDKFFESNPLKEIGYSQAIWTLLSVLEDYYFKISQIDKMDFEQQSIVVDSLLNTITHPIQICFNQSERKNKLQYVLNEEDYQNALEWIHLANHYNNYCTIFPMWHKSKIDIQIQENKLVTTEWSELPLQYEVYNRIVRKDGKKDQPIINPQEIIELLTPPNISIFKEKQFKVNFNPKLVEKLVRFCTPFLEIRHTLPDDWESINFSLKDFKLVYITIQSMLCAWNTTRSILVLNGLPQLGYCSSVWVEKKGSLFRRLKRYTKIDGNVLSDILEYITFGKMSIRNPDAAIQPLIDLENGYYALAPFIWLNTNSERNLCALLNQIPNERDNYSKLTQFKEDLLRDEIKNYLEPLGYGIVHGNLEYTDLDIGIVDRASRACIAMELKWFIEPAEVREIADRSEELEKGVSQVKLINNAFNEGNKKLIETVLSIEEDYDFIGIVGSRNWIGHFDVQDTEVPIIKVWHLLEVIKEKGSLKETIHYLRKREYLPVQDKDYTIESVDVKCGDWKCDWYGIKIIEGYTRYCY